MPCFKDFTNLYYYLDIPTQKVCTMSFNKEQLIHEYFETVQKLNYQKHTVIVSAGGAMVLHGLRETTQDLDLDTNRVQYAHAAKTYPGVEDGFPRLSITPSADLHSVQVSGIEAYCVIKGVWTYTLEHLVGVYSALAKHPARNPAKIARDLASVALLQAKIATQQ